MKEVVGVRFTGESLNHRSMPIYELGCTLIALQRIMNKSYLFAENKLEKGAHLPTRKREELALQVAAHRQGSDIWGLAPYLSDPAVGPIFQGLLVAGLSAIGAYAWKTVTGNQKEVPSNQNLIINIFPEIKSLTDRIGNIGGVETIEIFSDLPKAGVPLTLTRETQDYVREVEYQLIPGEKTQVSGVVTRLSPQSQRLHIQDKPRHFISVVLTEKQFEKIRLLPSLLEREITFEGTPQYRLGEVAGDITEFIADRVILRKRKDP